LTDERFVIATLKRKRRAVSRGLKPWELFAALGILIIFLFVAFTPSGQKLSGLGGTGSTGPTTGISADLPIAWQCYDALTGSNCGAVTISVFLGTASAPAETLVASASGSATSGHAYQTGTALTVEVSGNGKVTEFLPFTVPPVSSTSQTTNPVTLYAITLGSWTQSLTGTNGATTFVSGSQYALSTFTGSSTTITDSITESTNNAGYKNSYDIVNLINQYFVVRVDDGGGASSGSQYLALSGLANNVKVGNTNYYFEVCPDGLISGFGTTQVSSGNYISVGGNSFGSSSGCTGSGLSLQTVGTTTSGGAVAFSFTVKQGSLTTGNVETLSFKMFYYTDPAYFAANGGNMGPNAVQTGSTFTIKFNP
jgi:hypothetical protein